MGQLDHAVRFCRDADRVNEEWWSDMDAVRRKVGLLDDEAALLAPQRKTAKASLYYQ